MKFAEIPGNQSIKQAMLNMVESGRVPHSLMLFENDGCGALALGLAFLQYLNCQNRNGGDSCGECHNCKQIAKLTFPDLRFTFPITSGTKVSGEAKTLTCDSYAPLWKEQVLKNPYFTENELTSALGIEKKSGLITVAEGRAIMNKLSLAPVSDGYRGIFIWLPEKMNQSTANMLLKSLEEPEEKTIFILITHSPESVLPTISSRCQGIRVLPLGKEELAEAVQSLADVPGEEAVSVAAISGGSIGAALQRLSDEGETSVFDDLFKSLIDSLICNDLSAALQVGEALAGLESREKQKAFCIFAGEAVRAIMLYGRGLGEISGVGADAPWYREVAGKLPQSFAAGAGAVIGRAASMIERNVSAKMVFCNLVTRLYYERQRK